MSSTNKDIVLLFQQLQRCLHQSIADSKDQIHDLTILQLHAVMLVKNRQRVTMGELAQHLNLSPASASALAERLVNTEWLVRVPDSEDRRVIYLELSEGRESQVHSMLRKKTGRMEELLEHLPEQDRSELKRILTYLSNQTNKLKEN